jgi:hypothetical protein
MALNEYSRINLLSRLLNNYASRSRNQKVIWIAGLLVIFITNFIISSLDPGRHRLSAWYPSPNDLGAVAGSILVLASSILLFLDKYPYRFANFILIGSWAAISVVLEIAIIGSCSRGGLFTVSVGLLLCSFSVHNKLIRQSLAILLVGCIIGFFLHHKSSERLISQSSLYNSMDCRTSLWKSASAMIYDYPMGIGSGDFMEVSESWYLDHPRGIPLANPLNDYLYIFSENGILLATGYLMIFIYTIILLINFGIRIKNDFVIIIAGYSTSWFFSGIFNCMIRKDGPLAPWIIIGIAVLFICYFHRKDLNISKRIIMISSCICIILVSGTLLVGKVEAKELPWKPIYDHGFKLVVPRNAKLPSMGILIKRSNIDSRIEVSRDIMRRLSSNGISAMYWEDRPINLEQGFRIILCLHGVNVPKLLKDNMQHTNFIGAILLDPSIVTFKSLMECGANRLLVVCGTEGIHPDRYQFDVHYLFIASVNLPDCWPRHFPRFETPIFEWINHINHDSHLTN